MSERWDYRLTVKTVDGAELWEVREIYYNEAGDPAVWSKEPAAPGGETWFECAEDLVRMLNVISKKFWDIDAKRWVDGSRQPVTP